MPRTRFAPSPTGSLHLGSALSASRERRLGEWFLLRIDDTDAGRNVPGGEEELVPRPRVAGDLVGRGAGACRATAASGTSRRQSARGSFRQDHARARDGTPTYHLASVVDDTDFAITQVVRGFDHRPNEALHRRLHEALGRERRITCTGLVLGPDGKKLSKRRHGVATIADVRESRPRRCEPISRSSAFEARRPPRPRAPAAAGDRRDRVAARRGARGARGRAGRAHVRCGARAISSRRELARAILEPAEWRADSARPTLVRFAELRASELDGKEIVRELKAVGGDLKALRLALTGRRAVPSSGR